MPAAPPTRIDIHSHFLPDFYQQACREKGHANPDGMPYLPGWSAEEHLAMMERAGISKSILSISTPGTHLVAGDDAHARKLTRDCNHFAAGLRAAQPTRFGYFASLPLPDVAGSLAEIAAAAAEGCDGFAVETNHHGHYLGDALFDPVFDELQRRKAVLFVHPTTPHCPCSPGALAAGEQPARATPFEGRIPNPMLEFFFDTARIVSNLFLSGTIRRCPDVRIILPHLGGAFVPLLSRWTMFSGPLGLPGGAIEETEVRAALAKQFWFDMAGVPFPGQLRALLAGADISPSRLMYGSDFPFTRVEWVEDLQDKMEKGMTELFDKEQIEDIHHRNAEKLLAM